MLPTTLAALAAIAALGTSNAAPAPQKVEWDQAKLEALARDIQDQVAELRGESFKRPVAVQVATAEDFFAYARARVEETETPQKLAADETIAKMLGLVPPKMDFMETLLAMLETQVGGYYDPASDSFSLMDKCPTSIAPVILAHELDHALDDQLFGIDQGLARVSEITDASTAYSSVVEGSGTNIMSRWMVQYAQWAKNHGGSIDLAAYARMQQDAQEPMLQAPMFMWKPMFFVYLRGSAFLVRSENFLDGSMREARPGDIRTAFNDPPRSTEQILHPEKYWDPQHRDDPRPVVFDTSKLPAGWEVLREDSLGELVLAIVTTPDSTTQGIDVTDAAAQMAVEFTNLAAEGWGGDRVILLGKEDARFLRLATSWDTERDAAEFMGALAINLPGMRAACAELGPKKTGVTATYGSAADQVIVDAYFGVGSKDLRELSAALTQ